MEVYGEVRNMKKILAMSVICTLAMAVAAPAFAQEPTPQGPTREGYDVSGQDPESLSAIDALPAADASDGSEPGTGDAAGTEEAAGTEQAVAGESLPFTGLDVGIVAMLGAALLGTGVAVRRAARSSQP